MIIWFTGQSKAGKTTIARALQNWYRDIAKTPVIILDGDDMRESISQGAGFSREERTKHNLRVAKLANVLERQMTVIVSVIAPIETTRKALTQICHPLWIYIKRTLPQREGHFYEEPIDYFTVDHDVLSIDKSLNKIITYIESQHE